MVLKPRSTTAQPSGHGAGVHIWSNVGNWRANFHFARIRAFEAPAQPWTLCVNLRTLHGLIAVLAPAVFGIPGPEKRRHLHTRPRAADWR